jgi:hypothetical protein
MRGNSHVRFLEGLGGRKAPWPTRLSRIGLGSTLALCLIAGIPVRAQTKASTDTANPVVPVVVNGPFDSPSKRADDTGTSFIGELAATSSTWTLRTSPNRPRAREAHAMAYHTALTRTVLFGGYGWEETSTGGHALQLDDTWTWDGADWQQLTSSLHPSGRMSTSVAYDELRQELVLFGGRDLFSTGPLAV